MKKEEFVNLVIRKNYLSKTSGKDLSKELNGFRNNIKITSDLMFYKFQNYFERSGMNIEDVLSMSTLYAYYYLDIYSSSKSNEKDDKNGLITFIRQRVQYLAMICDRESCNFDISKNLSGFYAKTEKSKELPDDVLIANPLEYGYRKLSKSEIPSISKKHGKWKDKNGFDVVKLEFFDKISSDEYENILYSDCVDLMSPEEIILKKQEKEKVDSEIIKFQNKDVVDKIEYLKKLMKTSKDREKVSSAKKLLGIIKKDERYIANV